MTLHKHEGLTAILVDNEAIAIYVEDVLSCEMTLTEWKQINTALEGLKDE